ncbi:hypothetical protein AB1Y20_022778 [Prymnesium parvum]|uniref:Uncharacterized protein n=1 Tax=Prymnesium parvum TaxID=97485 RepID=A0AB34JKQ1_PRYPA
MVTHASQAIHSPLGNASAAATLHDKLIRHAVFYGLDPPPDSPPAAVQRAGALLHLPCRLGGQGFTSAVATAPAAFLAASLEAFASLRLLHPHFAAVDLLTDVRPSFVAMRSAHAHILGTLSRRSLPRTLQSTPLHHTSTPSTTSTRHISTPPAFPPSPRHPLTTTTTTRPLSARPRPPPPAPAPCALSSRSPRTWTCPRPDITGCARFHAPLSDSRSHVASLLFRLGLLYHLGLPIPGLDAVYRPVRQCYG